MTTTEVLPAPALRLARALGPLAACLAAGWPGAAAGPGPRPGAPAAGPLDGACPNPAAGAALAHEVGEEQADGALKLLQRGARLQTDAAQAQPFWRIEERIQAEERQAQQAQQSQAEQQPQQQAHGPPPEIFTDINKLLQLKVTDKLNSLLPELVKEKHFDPLPEVAQRDNLHVSSLEGLSAARVKKFGLTSVGLTLSAAGFSGPAKLAVHTEVPKLHGHVSRTGALGLPQDYQLTIGGAQVTLALAADVEVKHGGAHIVRVQVPKSDLQLGNIDVEGDGPRFEQRKLNEEMQKAKGAVQRKVGEKLGELVHATLSKMLPMPLHLDVSSSGDGHDSDDDDDDHSDSD